MDGRSNRRNKAPFSRAFSKSSVFGGQFLRISVDGRSNLRNKAPFSNSSGVKWTGGGKG